MIVRILFSFFLILIVSCAQVVSPTGGPIDNIPPLAVRYMPDSAATNVSPQRIIITFNEYVQLKDLGKEFVVSPTLKNTPDVAASGKTVTVKITDTLEPNTTYIVDFGKSVADITEANSSPFKYVFSTGSQIDTLMHRGRIINSLTKKPEPDFTVMLFKNLSDSAPYKEKPYYYTRGTKEGTFQFTNLKAGSYNIFALKDANGNFIPDPEEAIAFKPTPVVVDGLGADTLESFIEEPFKHYLKKTELPFPGKILLSYSKSVGDVELSFPDPEKSAVIHQKEYSREQDSLTIWYKDAGSDSIMFIAKSEFTNDTLEKKLPSAKGRRGGNQFTITSGDIDKSGFIYRNNPSFLTSAPLERIDTSFITLNVGQKKDTTVRIIIDTASSRKFTLQMDFIPDSSNKIIFRPGALKFFNGETNDTLTYTFIKRSTESFGTILLKMENVTSAGIAEILNEAGVVKARLHIGPGKENILLATELEPGNYGARLIHDTNGNKKWDTGNYIQKRQPEKVTFLNKGLPVKAGWDLEEDWKVD